MIAAMAGKWLHRERLRDAEAEVERLRTAVREVKAWCEEQQGYCRPPHLADAPPEDVDALRGPCAAYGAVVYGLVVDKLADALSEKRLTEGP